MAKSEKKDPAPTPLAVPQSPALRAEWMLLRCFEMAEKVLKKIEARINNDPAYQPSPSDLVGIFQATSAVQALVFGIPALQARADSLKADLAAFEAKLCVLFTGDGDQKLV